MLQSRDRNDSMKNISLSLALTLILVFASGCSTTVVSLNYDAKDIARTGAAMPTVTVAAFKDNRGRDRKALGAIRGGYGNPLKTLELDKPISDVFSEAFTHALTARGLYSPASAARYILRGTIDEFSADQVIKRKVKIGMSIRVTTADGSRTVFSREYRNGEREGSLFTLKTGYLAEAEPLRAFAEESMKAAIDELLDDPAFRRAISNGS